MFDDHNTVDVQSAMIWLALRHAMIEHAIECRTVGRSAGRNIPRGLRFSVWLVADLGDD